ncbi:MAG: DUF1292 domain-containing protein [Lachnospiraceae bacterium]|nr:DUF1292 domain-containing protein [Lachnospiraceae bacterium]
MEKIIFTDENGIQEELYVEEQVRLNGTDYLLVTDSEEDGANAFIFKDISPESSEEAAYVPLEEGDELTAVLKVFEEMLDDTEILL